METNKANQQIYQRIGDYKELLKAKNIVYALNNKMRCNMFQFIKENKHVSVTDIQNIIHVNKRFDLRKTLYGSRLLQEKPKVYIF
jgi:hypothetical protein